MCKRWKPRRVPSRPGCHQGEHLFPGSLTRGDDAPGAMHGGHRRRRRQRPGDPRHDGRLLRPHVPDRPRAPGPAHRFDARPVRRAQERGGTLPRKPPVPRTGQDAPCGPCARTGQTLGRDLSGRGRRECGAESLSRMVRVSRSGSGPPGDDQSARPRSGPTGAAARTPGTAGERPTIVATDDRPTSWRAAVAAGTAGIKPVSAVRCRPGSAEATAGAAAPSRPSSAAGPVVGAASSGARRRPPVDVVPSGARRRPPGTAGAGSSGARRRPPEEAGAATSGARRRPPEEAGAGTSGALRRPPAGGTVASGTTERSRTTGMLSVGDPASARCSRREEGWRATDSSRSPVRAFPGSGAISRWRSGSRRVSRSVQAVSSTPSRTTRTQTWQEPSPACRQPRSSPDHQAPAW